MAECLLTITAGDDIGAKGMYNSTKKVIGLELDIDRMLSRILERTFEFLNYDRGVILLIDEKGELEPRAYKTSDSDNKVTLSSTLIQQVQK